MSGTPGDRDNGADVLDPQEMYAAVDDRRGLDERLGYAYDKSSDTVLLDKDGAEVRSEDPLDALLDKHNLPLENFITDLEQRMIAGESVFKTRRWAMRDYKIGKELFDRYTQIIRGTWALEGTTSWVLSARRDELRQMYRRVYNEAMESEEPQLYVAIKAVDSMAKLDGLHAPEVTVNVDARGQPGAAETAKSPELTNRLRQRTQELMQLMMARAERHAASATKAITEAQNPGQTKHDEALRAPSEKIMGVVK